MKPFIIAEVGSNWITLADCIESIHEAKQAGADAIKFQLFDYQSLYGLRGKSKHQLPIKWLPELKSEAYNVSIEFMCSAFSPDLYEVVNPHVYLHKIASAELSHIRILQKLKTFGKPVILSVGGHGTQDIKRALAMLDPLQVSLLHCVAAYPTRDANLEAIDMLRLTYQVPVGFSDHTTDVTTIPYLACTKHKASILEKHFTAIKDDTPDKGHSLDPFEFTKMVHKIKYGPNPSFGMTWEESAMVKRHNRRLIATRDIVIGEKLMENVNFGIFRALTDETQGLSPWMLHEINGKLATKDIRQGQGISIFMIR